MPRRPTRRRSPRSPGPRSTGLDAGGSVHSSLPESFHALVATRMAAPTIRETAWPMDAFPFRLEIPKAHCPLPATWADPVGPVAIPAGRSSGRLINEIAVGMADRSSASETGMRRTGCSAVEGVRETIPPRDAPEPYRRRAQRVHQDYRRPGPHG